MKIEFKTGNEAFSGDSFDFEVARILRDVASKIETGVTEGIIRDVNGNTIGTFG